MTEKPGEGIEFISATVHELKTPLTAIITSVELLAEELQPEEGSTEGRLIQSIIRNARSIDQRLSHFSEMSRLLVGDLRFQSESVELQGIIRNVTTQLYPIDLPPENDTSYNLVKRGNKWPRKVTNRNRSSTSSGKPKSS